MKKRIGTKAQFRAWLKTQKDDVLFEQEVCGACMLSAWLKRDVIAESMIGEYGNNPGENRDTVILEADLPLWARRISSCRREAPTGLQSLSVKEAREFISGTS